MRGDVLARLERLEEAADQRRAGRERVSSLDVIPHIAPVYYRLHESIREGEYQNFNLPGGRGSGKSSFAALELVNGVMQDQTGETNAIAFRRYAVTLRDSCYSQIAWAIDALGVADLWSGSVSPMAFTYRPTGAQIVFRGLDDTSKLKSIRPKRGAFRLIWVEEMSELPGSNFLRNVMQSVMRGTGEGFVVLRTFNPPRSRSNWANVFIAEPDERGVTLLTTYQDMPPEWLGEAFLYEAERLQEINPTAYENEYLGLCTGDGGEVFGDNLEVRTITDEEAKRLTYRFAGVDFGFSVDPACFLLTAYDRKRETVYILDEIYKRGLSNKQLAKEIKAKGHHLTGALYSSPFGGDHLERQPIICDCAEPKSVADLRGEGLKARPCHKSPGCVEYRIKWLQHRRIVVDPKRAPNTARELQQYEYKRTKDGELTSELVDANNHGIDALAYSLDSLIYGRVSA